MIFYRENAKESTTELLQLNTFIKVAGYKRQTKLIWAMSNKKRYEENNSIYNIYQEE